MQEECHGNQGHFTTIVIGEVTGNLYSPGILWAAVQGVHVHEGLMSIEGPLRPLERTRLMPWTQYHRAV